MSQEDLAYKADVDRSYLSELERGKYSPSIWIVYRLCDTLKIKPSELLLIVEKNLEK